MSYIILFVGYETFYPELFRPVLSHLLASLAYNNQWLKATLPNHHPLFTSTVWTCGILPQLLEGNFVQGGCGRNPVTGLTASGIPPHILIANEIVKLRNDMTERHLEIVERIDEMPAKVKELMLANFTVNGVVPITSQQVSEMMDGLRSSLLNAIENSMQSIIRQGGSAPAHENDGQRTPFLLPGTRDMNIAHSWGGKFHPVPEGFQFPV
jgi:hypothetical protein